ncbi:cupin domain-containing protein [Symbioplanes lichenis]|uniref:cupin domain-containing protein n=1 Tax=Symbioplanes lichenis TaxID=1629072 RepID=UPI00273A4AE1|nr:cupin domain-containing protein [Actinoplanes lichenis]
MQHHWPTAEPQYEPDYNVLARRLPRLADEPYEGGAWVVVEPGTTMSEHVNPGHETEIFFFLDGAGVMRVEDQHYQVGPGDVVIIPPDHKHSLTNEGTSPLRSLALWWGAENENEEGR